MALSFQKILPLLLILEFSSNAKGQHQYATLYKQSGTCTSNIPTNIFTHHVSSGTPAPALTHPNNDYSSGLFFGMWQFQVCMDTACNIKSQVRTEVANQARCVGLSPNVTWSAQPAKLVRFGGDSMNAQELYLYSTPDFVNEALNITTRDETYSYDINVQSFFFTGNHAWRLYEGSNFKGRSYCLRPDALVVRNGYGFTYNAQTNYRIRSVRYSCNGAELKNISIAIILVAFLGNFLHVIQKNR